MTTSDLRESVINNVRIVGPRDQHSLSKDWPRVDTTSHSRTAWTTELSPFHLGPCDLYGGHKGVRVENSWQFCKVYKEHLGPNGEITGAYWRWAKRGWSSSAPIRYPMGKGARPEFLLWDSRRLGYVDGRLEVYWQLYRDAVAQTGAFAKLETMAALGKPFALFDLDGHDHDAAGVPLQHVITDASRPMGHAFVLKCMLLFGRDVTPADVLAAPPLFRPPAVDTQRTQRSTQDDLFAEESSRLMPSPMPVPAPRRLSR